MQSAFNQQEGFSFEARFIADPNDVRMLQVRGEYIPREDGSPGRLLGITQDVTEERAEQVARLRVEEQLRRSFEEAIIGMVILDMDSIPLYVNNALCEILGLTEAEVLGHNFHEFTHPEDLGDDVPVIEALLSGAQKHHVREKRYVHADGHTIWAEVAVSLTTNPDGSPLHMVGQIQDITERHALVEQLRQMADHDPLTGLLNRRAFGRELSAHLARTERYGATGALLMFDLDNFKLHNDTHGHSAGDDLLVALADGLRRRLRASDVTGRLGGDEFATLVPNADAAHARLVGESLLAHIRESDGDVTASIGLVCFERLAALSPEAALRAADEALYEAKRMGRNCVAEWAPTTESFIPASDSVRIPREPCPLASAAAWCHAGCVRRSSDRS